MPNPALFVPRAWATSRWWASSRKVRSMTAGRSTPAHHGGNTSDLYPGVGIFLVPGGNEAVHEPEFIQSIGNLINDLQPVPENCDAVLARRGTAHDVREQ